MAGITKLLTSVRQEIATLRQHTRKRFGEMQTELDSLRTRLDKIDLPKQTQKGAAAKKAAAKPAKTASAEATKPAGPRRPVPVPDRPEAMQDAGVGVDPR